MPAVSGMISFLLLIPILMLPLFGLYALFCWFKERWIVADRSPGKKTAILALGALLVSSPYLLFSGCVYRMQSSADQSRVPQQLQVAEVEYRLEKSSGIGMPGDNETGFVVYKLTDASARWARSHQSDLHRILAIRDVIWWPTPVDDERDKAMWHNYDVAATPPHDANLNEYLDRYGFAIPVEEGRDTDFNAAIRTPGSIYTYKRGGSVTVVDPKRGKIYFAYAG